MRLAVVAALVVALCSTGSVAAQRSFLGRPLPAQGSSPPAASVPESGFYVEDAGGGSVFEAPVAVAFAPDGRMFVAEKRGLVWVVADGVRLPEPFVDLQAEVLDNVDRGLLGLAVDKEGRVLVLYTVDHDGTGDYDRTDAFGRLTRYSPLAGDPNRADPASRRVLVGETFGEGFPNCFYSHAVGTVALGADGTLLVGSGEGASFSAVDTGGLYPDCFGPGRFDPSEDIGAFRALRLESLGGKILRIDPETGQGLPSNPYWTGNGSDNASKVWAYGLRNPFRFTVRPGGSADPTAGDPGLLMVGDVGWQHWEELNGVQGGENYAWPCREGPEPQVGYPDAAPPSNGCSTLPPFETPEAYWNQFETEVGLPPGRIAWTVIGGAFNEGTRYPGAYAGAYFYGDFTWGWSAAAHFDADGALVSDEPFDPGVGFVVDYEYDPTTGLVHLVDLVFGKVYRLLHTGDANAHPAAHASVNPPQGSVPLTVTFSSEGSADPEGAALTYRWRFGDGAESSEPNPRHTYAEEGVYHAVLLVSDGAATALARVPVPVGRSFPAVAILTPVEDVVARPGEVALLQAAVADPDQPDETLSVAWAAELVHEPAPAKAEAHVHPVALDLTALTGTLAVALPDDAAPGDVLYYRLHVTVTDDDGLTATAEGTLRVEAEAPPAPGAFGVEAVYPNPSKGRATVHVALDPPGRVAVEVFDVLGRRVYRREVLEEEAGTVALPVDLGGAGAGLYVLRVRHLDTGAVQSRRLVVAR